MYKDFRLKILQRKFSELPLIKIINVLHTDFCFSLIFFVVFQGTVYLKHCTCGEVTCQSLSEWSFTFQFFGTSVPHLCNEEEFFILSNFEDNVDNAYEHFSTRLLTNDDWLMLMLLITESVKSQTGWHFSRFTGVGSVVSLPFTFLTDCNCGSHQDAEEVCMCDCVTVSVYVYECMSV